MGIFAEDGRPNRALGSDHDPGRSGHGRVERPFGGGTAGTNVVGDSGPALPKL